MIEHDEPLPPFAEKSSDGAYMEIGAQLATRDGRRFGNAFVNETYVSEQGLDVAEVVTDAGNVFRMTERELKTCFYSPRWVMKIDEARAKFLCKPKPNDVQTLICALEIALSRLADDLDCPRQEVIRMDKADLSRIFDLLKQSVIALNEYTPPDDVVKMRDLLRKTHKFILQDAYRGSTLETQVRGALADGTF